MLAQPNQYIPGLDGVRAIAVTLVLLTHLHVFKTILDAGWMPHWFVTSLSGPRGVYIFFVLSGFLITHLLVAEHRRTGTIALGQFMRRRARRILPLYLLFCLLCYGLFLAGSGLANHAESFLYLFTFTYNFIPKYQYSMTLGHSWSLAVEEHFYLLWPLVFLLFARRRAVLMGCLVAGGLLLFALKQWGTQSRFAEDFMLGRWTFFAGIHLMAGCALALLADRARTLPAVGAALGSPGALAAGVLLWFHKAFLPATAASEYLMSIGAALMIGWLFFNPTARPTRWLEWPPARYVGRISYGIYIWQGFFLATGPHRSAGQWWPPEQTLGLLMLIVVAPLSYHFFEVPIRNLKKKPPMVGRRRSSEAE